MKLSHPKLPHHPDPCGCSPVTCSLVLCPLKAPVAVVFLCVAVDAGGGGEMPGQSGVFQRRPEGRLGALAEQQETRLQAASDGHGRQKHHPI